jgi:type I site-specific restriction-modification system R (restriction) subunit
MYVDKVLSSMKAVQTLSRLNRDTLKNEQDSFRVYSSERV